MSRPSEQMLSAASKKVGFLISATAHNRGFTVYEIVLMILNFDKDSIYDISQKTNQLFYDFLFTIKWLI